MSLIPNSTRCVFSRSHRLIKHRRLSVLIVFQLAFFQQNHLCRRAYFVHIGALVQKQRGQRLEFLCLGLILLDLALDFFEKLYDSPIQHFGVHAFPTALGGFLI